MCFSKEIEQLSNRSTALKSQLKSEEGAKTALVLPLLQILGYDIFNPKQIMPELIADIGTKKSERVDYAIMSSGNPKLIIECKKIEDKLQDSSISQLFRYFTALRVKFSILTNGLTYQFFSDIETPNIMDSRPFFTFNLESYSSSDLDFLYRFRKGCLVGQMKALKTLCKKRKLRNYVREEVSEILIPSKQFVNNLKLGLLDTRLSSVTKKELAGIASELILEECIKVVEKHRNIENLAPILEKFVYSITTSTQQKKLCFRKTPNSIYLETSTGVTILRIFTIGLTLKINCADVAATLRVVGDVAQYTDIIKKEITQKLKNKES